MPLDIESYSVFSENEFLIKAKMRLGELEMPFIFVAKEVGGQTQVSVYESKSNFDNEKPLEVLVLTGKGVPQSH